MNRMKQMNGMRGIRRGPGSRDPHTLHALTLAPLPTRPFAERWLVRLLAAALAAGAYLLFLPWDLRSNVPEHPGSDNLTSRIEGDHVLLLVATVLLLAAYMGFRDGLVRPPLLVGLPPAALLYASLTTHARMPDAAIGGPFVYGFFFVLCLAGPLLAAAVGRRIRQDEEQPRR